MGFDKAQLEIKGKTLVQGVYDQVKKQADHVVISGPYNYGLNIQNLEDNEEGPAGPAGALYTLLQELNDGREPGFFTCLLYTSPSPRDQA